MDILDKYLDSGNNQIYKPEFFRLQEPEDKVKFRNLLQEKSSLFVHNEIDGQLRELVKCRNPHLRIKDEDYPALVNNHINNQEIDEYGVWIYYPWSNRLVHNLDEEEFIEIRTNRNKYKLTTEEQKHLSTKKIGIIGLSVGQSIALTVAMERICGELRLADFDTAELSNLNRIRTGIHNLGLKKTIIAAREISEIDPYLNVKIFNDGLHKDNIEEFFTGDGKLDVLIEVCDGLDIKILSRFRARDLGIPVVMDTNDRGMMDIERFDLEPNRPILHGLAGDLNPENIKDLSNEQKIPYIFKMVGVDTLSTRLKASMMEVSQSINTWPQLASSVVLGGALTTDVVRRIFLNQYHDSGRYYIDLDDLLGDKILQHSSDEEEPIIASSAVLYTNVINEYFDNLSTSSAHELNNEQIEEILSSARKAPAYNNAIYWTHYYKNGILFLFFEHNESKWDKDSLGALMSFGATLENIYIQSAALGLQADMNLSTIKKGNDIFSAISFKPAKLIDNESLVLANNISKRKTTRDAQPTKPLQLDFFTNLLYFVRQDDEISIMHTVTHDDIVSVSNVCGAMHRLQLLDQEGHEEFYGHIKWDEHSTDGIPVNEMGFTDGEKAGYSVGRDWNAMKLLSDWDRGNVFKLMASHKIHSASAILAINIKSDSSEVLIKAGRMMQRIWLYCCNKDVNVQPIITPMQVISRYKNENAKTKNSKRIKIDKLKEEIFNIFPLDKDNGSYCHVFLMKLTQPA